MWRRSRRVRAMSEQPKDASAGSISWEYGIPLATNPFMLWDFTAVTVISVLGFYLLLGIMGLVVNGEMVLPPFQAALIFIGILLGLFLLVSLLLFGNRFSATFTVDEQGVGYRVGSRGRWLTGAALAVGMLSRRPGLVGAALLAQARETGRYNWEDIRRTTVHRRLRVVSLDDGWHTVLRLYCPPDIFDEVVARVQAHVAEAEDRPGPRDEHRPLRSPWYFLGWSAVSIVATIMTMVWPWLEDQDYRLSLLVGLPVFLTGFVSGTARQLIGAAAVIGSLYFLARLALAALAGFEYPSAETPDAWVGTYTFTLDSGALAVAALGGAIRVAMSGLAVLGRLDGPPTRRARRSR